jgi:hypothetical protein
MKRNKYNLVIIEILILTVIALLSLTGCTKQEKLKELKIGEYVMQDTEPEGMSYILIEEDHKFKFIRNLATSYLPMGTYSIEGNELTLYVDENESYVFTIEKDQLIFKSSNVDISQFVKKGAVFKLSEDKQVFLYDAYEELVINLKDMGYTIKAEDVEKSILLGERKWLTINESDNISVYLYESNDEMEKDASYLSDDGFSYDNGREAVDIGWVSYPHFFKSENMIILYVGENSDIICLFEELVGPQFAGEVK